MTFRTESRSVRFMHGKQTVADEPTRCLTQTEDNAKVRAMDNIAGRVWSNGVASITEAKPWEEPCRILIINDESGVRHGRIEWFASEIDEEFEEALDHLRDVALRKRVRLALVSSQPSVIAPSA